MTNKYFVVTLLPPRAESTTTITATKKAIMEQHAMYWQQHLDKGLRNR